MLELGSNRIEVIENLDNLPCLKQLYLGKNRISEIQGLEHLSILESITLGVNYYSFSQTKSLKLEMD